MAHNEESESRAERRREERIDKIRETDPGFIPPVRHPSVRSKTSLWMWVGVGIFIILLLVWLSVAMFTGDTDVNLITPFPWR